MLLTSTALCGLAGGAAAQLAPNARPAGGQVVAGSATIATAPTTTTIDQTTQRAAINWQSFNVGAGQAVVFQQPSASAMTLNTVVGPNPSAIAGRITANGGIVITNQSGVVFHAGAQVDATSLVVSAPGITTQNFMAGHMVFDQAAKPGAAVVNQGTLTIKQAGLAALVAPQVRNSGVINAKLGHVVLAGAAATTLDLYGDGLVSIDITKQVTAAPGGQAALVTNTGLVNAAGGTVQLTAAAADGVVTNLVDARGRISAATVGQRTGTIAINGTGGALLIEGSLRADGAQGGAIEVAGTGAVVVGATARISANGRQGGGTVALGTTLARARGGAAVTPTVIAQTVSVGAGARISANATRSGNGGTVTLLSLKGTDLDGSITATGGRVAGNGGRVEVSSRANVTLNGLVDVGAAHGDLGTILLDPASLTIVAGEGSQDTTVAATGTLLGNQPDTTSTQTVSNTVLDNLRGNIVLQATQTVTVSAPITLTVAGQSLTIQSGGGLFVDAPIVTQGNITLAANAAVAGAPTPSTTGGLVLDAAVSSSAGSVSLTAATSAGVFAAVTAGPGQQITVAAPAVTIGSVVTVPANAGAPQAAGPVNVLLQADALTLSAGDSSASTAPLIVASGGIVAITPYTAGNSLAVDDSQAAAGLVLTTAGLGRIATGSGGSLYLGGTGGANAVAGAVTFASPLDVTGIAGTLGLFAQYGVTEPGSSVTAGTLLGTAGTLAFGGANAVATLGPFTTVTGFTLNSTLPLSVVGPVTGTAAQIALSAPSMTLDGLVAAPTVKLSASSGGIDQLFGVVTANTLSGSGTTVILPSLNNILSLGPFTASGPFQLTNGISLTVAGPVTDGGGPLTITAANLAITGVVSTPLIILNSSGSISLTNLADPTSLVQLASASGSITGNLQAASLLVQGSGGSAALTGSVFGFTGGAAAGLAQIMPAVNPNYRLNGCEIGVVGCGATLAPTPTPTPTPFFTPTAPTEATVPSIPTPAPETPVTTPPPTATLLLPAPAIDDLAQVLGLPLIRPASPPGLLDFAFPATLPGEANPEIVLPNVSGRDY